MAFYYAMGYAKKKMNFNELFIMTFLVFPFQARITCWLRVAVCADLNTPINKMSHHHCPLSRFITPQRKEELNKVDGDLLDKGDKNNKNGK